MDRSGADFMVDVIKSLGFEYVASNPGSSFRGLRHRHTGAAINCYLQGSGYSVVEGVKYPWKAGELLISVKSLHQREAEFRLPIRAQRDCAP